MDLHTIVALARAPTTTHTEAVKLIETYASVVAGEAVHQALEQAHLRTMQILEMPLTRVPDHA